jgi:hypothetical protein
MAARVPRKLFANPFVVTLAALPACFTESSPPPPQQPQVAPAPKPVEPGGEPVAPGGTPQAQTYTFDQRWTVTKSGDTCTAMQRVECPKPKKPGDPVMTCNPPAPMKVACPDGWDSKEALTIVQYANQATCMVEPPPMKCPKNAICNPPPPRKVACPTLQ